MRYVVPRSELVEPPSHSLRTLRHPSIRALILWHSVLLSVDPSLLPAPGFGRLSPDISRPMFAKDLGASVVSRSGPYSPTIRPHERPALLPPASLTRPPSHCPLPPRLWNGLIVNHFFNRLGVIEEISLIRILLGFKQWALRLAIIRVRFSEVEPPPAWWCVTVSFSPEGGAFCEDGWWGYY